MNSDETGTLSAQSRRTALAFVCIAVWMLAAVSAVITMLRNT